MRKKTNREEDSYSKEKEGPVKHDKGQEVSDTEFIDDYEEDDFEKDWFCHRLQSRSCPAY